MIINGKKRKFIGGLKVKLYNRRVYAHMYSGGYIVYYFKRLDNDGKVRRQFIILTTEAVGAMYFMKNQLITKYGSHDFENNIEHDGWFAS